MPSSFEVHEADGSRLTVELAAVATGWSVSLSAATTPVILRVRANIAPAAVTGDGLTTTYDTVRKTSIVRVAPHAGTVMVTARNP